MLKSCVIVLACYSFQTESILKCKPCLGFFVCLGLCGVLFCLKHGLFWLYNAGFELIHTHTHLGKHPLHFLPVLWLTADSVIKGHHLGFEQRNRGKPLSLKDVPFRVRPEDFRQTQIRQEAITNILYWHLGSFSLWRILIDRS